MTSLLPGTCNKPLRQIIMARRAIMERQLVKSIHVPIKLLTDKERAELKKVQDKMTAGINPYSKGKDDATPDAGGSVLDRKARASEAQEVFSQERFETLCKRWEARAESTKIETVSLDMDSELIFGKQTTTKRDPSKLYCALCGCVVDRTVATVGRLPGMTKFRKAVQIFVDRSRNRLTFNEDWVHLTGKKVVMCPDHALLIGPSLDREGYITRNNVETPTNE